MSGTESRLYLYWLHELRVIDMDRLDTDFLVIDLLVYGAPAKYVLRRLVGIDIDGGC